MVNRERRLRKSQLITPFGIGAIIEFPKETLMHAGINAYTINDELKLIDDRLAHRLNVRDFYEPINAQEKFIDGGVIPFVRFPLWHFCSRCRAMYRANWNDSRAPKCDSDLGILFQPDRKKCSELNERARQFMVPVRFILVCEHGHIRDFPWVEWAHSTGARLEAAIICDNPKLRLPNPFRSGLTSMNVKCENCQMKKNLGAASSKNAFSGLGCGGERPWLGPDASEDCECNIPPRLFQKGATNIHFPNIVSSILIPPYSTYVRRLIGKDWEIISATVDENGRPTKEGLKMYAAMKNISPEALEKAVNEKLSGDDRQAASQSEADYRFQEYEAFMSEKKQGIDDDLIVIKQNITDYEREFARYFDEIMLVEKLTETRAVTGFSRLNPPDGANAELAPLSPQRKNWLPAIRAYGEGIFFTLNQELIDKWMNSDVNNRVSELQSRYRDRGREANREISAVFLLLHTLSHILIRRLSFDCGYGSASLRERIYFSQRGGETMAGILIYTSASDSEGTLGGLVRQGKAGKFEKTLAMGLVDTMNCSSDPLCAESTAQGTDGLNLAACHACALLPETCCEESNLLLDRMLLVGTPENEKLGFFSKYLSQIIDG